MIRLGCTARPVEAIFVLVSLMCYIWYAAYTFAETNNQFRYSFYGIIMWTSCSSPGFAWTTSLVLWRKQIVCKSGLEGWTRLYFWRGFILYFFCVYIIFLHVFLLSVSGFYPFCSPRSCLGGSHIFYFSVLSKFFAVLHGLFVSYFINMLLIRVCMC